jgi:hypothetical protein
MNSIEDDKIMKDFILVIKKNPTTGRLYSDKIEFEKIFDSYIKRLIEKSEDDDYSILDLEDSILNTENPLKKLYDVHHDWYSPKPSDSYNQESYLSRINRETYEEKEEELDTDIKKSNYKDCYKKMQVLKIELFTRIYYLGEAYKKAEADPLVLFYSHGTPGWKDRSFMVNDIFKMDFSSNFGYGWVSYLHSVMTYNDIQIIPYSYLIKYRYAEFSEIRRYTRRYEVDYSSWFDALTFGVEAYNLSVNNPNVFIKKYVFDEVEDMMVGLRELYKSKDKEEYVCELYKKKWTVLKEEVYEVIGEKFQEALKFVESLKQLKFYSTNDVYKSIDSFIDEILTMAIDVKESLKVKKYEFQTIIDQEFIPDLKIKEKTFELYHNETYLPLEQEVKAYEEILSDEEFQKLEEGQKIDYEARKKIKEKINAKFPLWISIEAENDKYEGEVLTVKGQIYNKEKYILKYSDIIGHIESMAA